MLTSAQQTTLASDMEKWYVAVADYACKTSKGIKTKNNINCLEAQLEIIATLYNNISTQDLGVFQYPIYQSCSDFVTEYISYGYGYSFPVSRLSGGVIVDGVEVIFETEDGHTATMNNATQLLHYMQVTINTYNLDILIADITATGYKLLSNTLVLGDVRVGTLLVTPSTSTYINVLTTCNTQPQNGTLTQSNITCLLAKLAEGVDEGTGKNVTPNYLMWGTDMVNDILDYGTSSNQHLKWRF